MLFQKKHPHVNTEFKTDSGGIILKEYVVYSDSPEKTSRLGYLLGQLLEINDIVLLDGDLGAGKTCFTGGLAKALGINEPASSPTYTLVNEYHSGKFPLYHYDAYRLSCGDELSEIGFDEQVGEGVVVVEWAVNAEDYFPENAIQIVIERLDSEGLQNRKIIMKIDEKRGDLIVNSLG